MNIKNVIFKNSLSRFIIIGFLLITLGISLILLNLIMMKNNKDIERNSLDKFYYNQETVKAQEDVGSQTKEKLNKGTINYIAVLKIPKLNIEKGLVNKSNKLNDIDKNIEILSHSNMPDIKSGNLILAAHSGTGKTAYFNELYKLEKDDIVIIVYNKLEYKYIVKNSYKIDKNGKANIIRNKSKDTLTLITCVPNEEKQLIVIAEK